MKRKTIFIFLVAIIISISCVGYYLYIYYDRTEYVIDDIYAKDDSIPKGTFYIHASDLTLDYPREKIIYPDDGYVPNELTAARIAEAVLVSKYGEKIYGQKPYRINLIKDSIWVVNGSVTGGGYGENAYIEIRKKDGKILKVFMGC